MTLVLAEEAAPAWVPIVALAIPITIMLAVLIPALKRRARYGAARQTQEGRIKADATELGSASAIVDPVGYSSEGLLKALAIAPEDHGPKDGMPHDEGWAGSMLGLKSKMSSSTSMLEPHVYWGTRHGRQVFIRMGPDERIEGNNTMFSNRHIRNITVLRVAAPPFQVDADDGTLWASEDSPYEIREIVEAMAADRVTWADTRITGGAEGIVGWRGTIDGVFDSWVYDLWLLEHIAATLGLEPLKPARIGPAWKVPYGLGRSLTPN